MTAYWRARLADGGWVPTRRVLEIVLEDIASLKASHEVWPEHLRQSFPFYELALLREALLKREHQRIRRMIEAEGETP